MSDSRELAQLLTEIKQLCVINIVTKRRSINIKPINALSIEYDEVQVFEQPALFTTERIDPDTIPEGLYAYEVEYGGDEGKPLRLAKRIEENLLGTVLVLSPIEFVDDIQFTSIGYESEDDWSWFGENEITSIKNFLRAYNKE